MTLYSVVLEGGRGGRADMKNVMSMTGAARVKFPSWGKFLALDIHCFVENVLSVVILHCF